MLRIVAPVVCQLCRYVKTQRRQSFYMRGLRLCRLMWRLAASGEAYEKQRVGVTWKIVMRRRLLLRRGGKS